jgi:XTP/dITP diphosphohydrolase
VTRVVVATRSAQKLGEIRQLLARLAPGLIVVDLDGAGIPETPEEEGIEIHDSFRGNALAKAQYFSGRAPGVVLADDSGLCVDVLGGAPGVRSKRFSRRPDLSGPELDRANNELLLARLAGLPWQQRGAHYVCVVALAAPDGSTRTFEGRCSGTILAAPRGDGGFGYDPLFEVDGEDATFGELPPERKNQISHRARAVSAALPTLLEWAHQAPDPTPRRPPARS